MKYRLRVLKLYPTKELPCGYMYYTDSSNKKYMWYNWDGKIKCYRAEKPYAHVRGIMKYESISILKSYYETHKRKSIIIPIR